MVPGDGVAALLIFERFVGLPESFDFGALQVAIADAIATIADRINRGAAGGAAYPLGFCHGWKA